MKYALFISHRSGDHGLTFHKDIPSLYKDLSSVADAIADSEDSKNEVENERLIRQTLRTLEGNKNIGITPAAYAEFSDSTWFDIFIIG